jgi:CBS domain-containing protein
MNPSQHDERQVAPPSDAEQEDHFLRLMFFQPHDLGVRGAMTEAPTPKGLSRFSPIPQARLRSVANYYLADPTRITQLVHAGSPALDVMTDLTRVAAATVTRLATVNEANATMIARGVRSVFVVDAQRIIGILTATDVLGEKPVQVGHELGIHHDEVLVRDIMTPAEQLEVIEFGHVLEATVGDVVATLRHASRQHALVSDFQEASTRQRVRGMFSLSQIARQLGITNVSPDLNRTFAQIEAVFGAA